jgi:hypothetical protein
VVESEHVVIGRVDYCIHEGLFYVHSLWSYGPKAVASMLIQAVRKEARALGFAVMDFYVSPEQPALMKFAQNGRAKVKQIWMEVRA